jgi:hypothetical protein
MVFTSWEFLRILAVRGAGREPHGGQPARAKDGNNGVLRVSFRCRAHLYFYRTLVFGTISFRANNWYVNHGYEALQAEHYGLYWSVGSIIAFLVVGLLVLLFVKRVTYKEAD